MAIIKGKVAKKIISEFDLFLSIIRQNISVNKLNSKYFPVATIKQGMVIEFTVKSENDLYLDLNNLRCNLLAKIIKADKTNIEANTSGLINMRLHSMFREIGF